MFRSDYRWIYRKWINRKVKKECDVTSANININVKMGCIVSNVRKYASRRSFHKSDFCRFARPVFGVPLIRLPCSDSNPYVPKIVVECIAFIERDENLVKSVYADSEQLPAVNQKLIMKLRRRVRWDGQHNGTLNFNYYFIKCNNDAHNRLTSLVITMQSKHKTYMLLAVCCWDFSKNSSRASYRRKVFNQLFRSRWVYLAHQNPATGHLVRLHKLLYTQLPLVDFTEDANQRKLIAYLHRLDAETYDTLKFLMEHLNRWVMIHDAKTCARAIAAFSVAEWVNSGERMRWNWPKSGHHT